MSACEYQKMSKNILFTVTGAFIYFVLIFAATLLLERLCPPEPMTVHDDCFPLMVILFFVSLGGLIPGVAFREWHRTGKWFWLKLVPAWRTA